MCIAIYKPKNINMPSIETLKTCFENNSDGAGIAIYNQSIKKWFVIKGLMKFKSFKKALENQKIKKTDIVILHFRIGTSGDKTAPFTHPFPISESEKALKELCYIAEDIIAHNGIIGIGSDSLSDTQEYIKDVISPVIDHLPLEKIIHLVENTSQTGKLCLAFQDKIFLTGDWIQDQGVFYSNSSYKPKKVYSFGYGKWDQKTITSSFQDYCFPAEDLEVEDSLICDNCLSEIISEDVEFFAFCPFCGCSLTNTI